MIEFTIKTLDSRDHPFTVDDEITVGQLKEKVQEQMGVEIPFQRLIFCGRVLADEKKLADYDVHGKVIHMVQRAPPCLEERETMRERERERERERDRMNSFTNLNSDPMNYGAVHFNHVTQQQIRRLMALASTAHGIEVEEQPGSALSPTGTRLDFLRRLIIEIRSTLDAIIQNESNEPRTFSSEDPLDPSTSQGESSSVPDEVMCQVHQRPLLYQLDQGTGITREGRGRRIRQAQSAVHTPPIEFGRLVAELHELHNEFAPYREAYITTLREASDANVELTEEALQRRQRTADLAAELYHSFSHAYHLVSDVGLMLAHRNSRLMSEALMRHPLPMQAHINVVQTPATRRQNGSATSGAGPSSEMPQPSSSQAGNPTVNIDIQPDPITYQVEIETRVPLEATAENQPQNDQTHVHDDTDLGNRPQSMNDFENLFRGLQPPPGIRGVEVLMSMEEITPVNGTFTAAVPSMNAQPEGNQPVFGSQIYLAQMPWGGGNQGAPSADLLQNIVSSVIRQGIVAGMEGAMTVHTQVPAGQGLGEGQVPMEADNAPSQQPDPNQTTQEQSQENQTNTDQNTNPNIRRVPRLFTGRRQATATARGQTVSLSNLVYDRFLQCDSHHARRLLQQRREETSLAGGPLLRDDNSQRVQNNVETLYERFDRSAMNEESLMIATMVTLREAISFTGGRTLVPDELQPLRHRLQIYMRDLMQGDYEAGTQAHLADLIFERHAEFINRITAITPTRPNVDVAASMKAVFLRFLNEAMSVLEMDNNEVFSRRFRIVYPRLFYELCGVISYCCLEGVEGLKKIYRSFLTELLQNVGEPIRDLLYSLSMENLNAAICRIEHNRLHFAQFIRRKEQQPSTSFASEGLNGTSSIDTSFLSPGTMPMSPTDGNEADAEVSDVPVAASNRNGESSSDTSRYDCAPADPAPKGEPSHKTHESKKNKSKKDFPPRAEISSPELLGATCKPWTLKNSNKKMPSKFPKTSTPREQLAQPTTPLSPQPNVTLLTRYDAPRVTSGLRHRKVNRAHKSGSGSKPDASGLFVPPESIAQHWGEEWVPTFTRDVQEQEQHDTAEPCSDAYLSGMPPKKRRCVRQSRPPTTLNSFIDESMNEVSSLTTVEGEELRSAFREHMRRIARERAAISDDYEPHRFVATARFLKQNRTSMRKSPESSSSE